MRSKYLLVFFAIVIPNIVFSQIDSTKQKQQHVFVSANAHFGTVLPTNEFVRGLNATGLPIDKYQSLSLKVGWQNPGYTNWQKIYRSPYYGLGLFIGDFFDQIELGRPISAYGYFGIPIARFYKFEIYNELQFGLTWNWKHYNSLTNPYNIAIGGGMTVHLDIGFNMFYAISDKFNIGLGYSFNHFSNGGFERPNRGLNLISPSLEVKYYFYDKPNYKKIEWAPKDLPKFTELNFMLEYGDHQMVEYELDTNYFSISGLGIFYSQQLGNAYRSGVGVDLNYWMSLSANPDGTMGDKSSWDNLTIGLIYAPELLIDRFSILTGFGIYAKHAKYGDFKQTYQRAAVKYHFTENFSFGVGVRAINFMLAEYLEFSLGYKIRWERKW
jgi:hypothetical protein